MSKQPPLIPGEAITGASVDVLLTTAQTLLREASDRVRAGTSDVSRDQLLDQVVTCQQVQNTAWAAQSVRLAQVAAIEEVLSPTGAGPREVRHPIGAYADEWLPQEVGVRLGWSDRQTTNRLGDAVDAIRCTPRLFGLVSAGALDPRKLSVVAETLRDSSPKVAREVESQLLAAIDDAHVAEEAEDGACEPVPLTSTKLVRRARRLLADVAPADAEKSAGKRRAQAKGVRVFPHHEPGLSAFQAILPTEDAMRAMAGVNELARQLHRDNTTGKSLDECRVDAFIDLLLGNVSISATCVVQIPLRPVKAEPAGSVGDHDKDEDSDKDSNNDHDKENEPTVRPLYSFVEPQLEELLRQSTRQGFDELTRLDTPTMNLVERRPCTVRAGSDPTVSDPGMGDPAQGRRIVTRVEIDLGATQSDSSQHLDPHAARPSRHRQDKNPASSYPDGCRLDPLARYRIGDVVIEGLGVIPAAVLTELCQKLGTELTRALVDAETGATVETSDITYRPGARLRRFVVTRDQHCRFPGCTRPARLDDVDHVNPWPDGDTSASNLQCLCRHHHRAKHEGGWRVSMTADGVCTWTSPSGRHYLTRPGD
ncbi:MAG TPA: HNH endonuclease signature motif containing protein [Flexivirga sp.]|uniref:HNH endonuclease signature motif containing protein n=1 Tax=Flexivirga sp. TaxID=1962927 RepID=UPI002BA9168D|nr:HNH endonuclease signature motif containing protein [Flexivirga sp.]HWC23700.1 HNH endonuclease signature motif containing protein [Flexivirga sp.]